MAVHTSDDHLLLIRRSGSVAEGQGALDVPGGHPEPSHIGIDSLNPSGIDSSKVLQEIFQSAIDEVRDEINIPEGLLGDVRLLGVVRQGNSGGCPSAALVVRCQCTSHEAKEWYKQGAKEAFETTSLHCLPVEDLPVGRLQDEDLTPAAQGCLKLFDMLVLGGSNSSGNDAGKGKRTRAAGGKGRASSLSSSSKPSLSPVA